MCNCKLDFDDENFVSTNKSSTARSIDIEKFSYKSRMMYTDKSEDTLKRYRVAIISLG